MAFKRECEMVEPVRRWLRAQGMMVKAEMFVPWGCCDLVGCSLDPLKVAERLKMRQRRPIGPPLRIDLLLRIPERGSVTLETLQQPYASVIDAERIAAEVQRLVTGRFVRLTRQGRLQRLNGWVPLHDRLVAVELKLSRVRQVLYQARAHRAFASESYAAFPREVAERVAGTKKREEFEQAGVGVLAVSSRRCEVVLRPRLEDEPPDLVTQMHCVERFWRTYLESHRPSGRV